MRAGPVALVAAILLLPFAHGDIIVSGTLTTSTVWSGNVQVTGNVTVAAGATLTVQPGTLVKLAAGVSVTAQSDAAISVQGTAAAPARFIPLSGNTPWGKIAASGNNSALTVRHAELAFGSVNLGTQATALIEDTFVHDVGSAIVGNSARFVTLRRVHVKNYSETIFNSGTTILAEDSLFENMTAASSDALEIQGGPPGSIIRRCSFRHSTGSNSDAVDFNSSSGVLVEDCLIYDFTDKGISLGAAGAGGQPDRDIVVRNCCIFRVDTGIAVKDGTTCTLIHNTVADSATGWRLYQKYATPVDGGHVISSTGNIVWNNGTGLDLSANSSVIADHGNFQNTNWPGLGNLSVNPRFVDAAHGDYRLAADSPCRGAGQNGADLGARFPVGAPMAPSHAVLTIGSAPDNQLRLRFWVDPEKSYSLLANGSLADGGWAPTTPVVSGPTPYLLELLQPFDSGQRFYQLGTTPRP